MNNPDYHWAVPGLGFAITQTQHYYDSFGTYFAAMSKEDFRRHLLNGAVKDGLTKVTTPKDRIGHYLVALAFPEGDAYDDFHWYRKDDNGTWSHKYGRHAPSNTDSDGKIITDPRDAARPDYPAFAGFFLVPRQGVELEQSFPLIPEA